MRNKIFSCAVVLLFIAACGGSSTEQEMNSAPISVPQTACLIGATLDGGGTYYACRRWGDGSQSDCWCDSYNLALDDNNVEYCMAGYVCSVNDKPGISVPRN